MSSRTLRVSLSSLAERSIVEELAASRALLDRGVETGGWLFSAGILSENPFAAIGIVLEVATDPGPNAERGVSSINFDTDYASALAEGFGLYGGWPYPL